MELRRHAGRLNGISVALAVDEAVEQVVSVLIRRYGLYRFARTGAARRYRDTRAGGTVLIAHITADFAIRITRTYRDGFLGFDITVTFVGHRQTVIPFQGDVGVGLAVFVPVTTVVLLQYRPCRIFVCRTRLNSVRTYIAVGCFPAQQYTIGELLLGSSERIEVRCLGEIDNRISLACRRYGFDTIVDAVVSNRYTGGINIHFIGVMYTRSGHNIGVVYIRLNLIIRGIVRVILEFVKSSLYRVVRNLQKNRIVQFGQNLTNHESLLGIQIEVAISRRFLGTNPVTIQVLEIQRECHLMTTLEIIRQTIGQVFTREGPRAICALFGIEGGVCHKIMAGPTPLRG